MLPGLAPSVAPRRGGPAEATYLYTGSINNPGSGPQTFSVDCGSHKKVIVGIYAKGMTNPTSVSVGASTLSHAVTNVHSFFIGDNPGGTQTITLSGHSSGSALAIVVWGVDNLESETLIASSMNSSGSPSGSLTVQEDGIAVGVSSPGNASGVSTWSSLTRDVDESLVGASNRRYSGASVQTPADGTLSWSVSYSSTSSSGTRGVLVASFR